jgi:hypothetical protein
MALLAESLVEEWLNRRNFFTIRGIKHGIGELDLLGIRRESDGTLTGWHVEVQASFRPVGYIAKLTGDLLTANGKRRARTSAVARTSDEIETCAKEWVGSKFLADDKHLVRNRLWPGVDWSFHLVHAVVRSQEELSVIEAQGVQCHSFHRVLSELLRRGKGVYSGSAGGDLAEIVQYFQSQEASVRTKP